MHKFLTTLMIISCSLLSALSAEAGSNIEYQSSFLWSGSEDVWVEGDYAYCVLANGLEVYDISNKVAPVKVSSLYLRGEGHALCKAGRYIYLADGSSGMAVIDAISPTAPVLVQFVPTGGDARGIFYQAARNQVYVVNYGACCVPSFFEYQLTEPANPLLVSKYQEGSCLSVFGVDNLAYLIHSDGDLTIVNVDSGDEIGRIPGSFWNISNKAVTVRDTVAFLAQYNHDSYNREGYLETWNVADPTAPVMIDSIIISSVNYDTDNIIVQGNRAYVSGGGLAIADVSNPAQLAELSSLSSIGVLKGIFLQDNYIFGVPGDYSGGMAVIDVINPSAPNLINSFDKTSSVNGVYARNGLLYVATERNGLYIFNVEDPRAPIQVGLIELINEWGNNNILRDVYLNGDLALVASSREVFILDVSNPTAPDSLATTGYIGNLYAMQIVDTLAYFSVGGGVMIEDISDPTNPDSLVSYNTTIRTTNDFFVKGGLAYTATDDGLFILDVSDPSNPVELGSFLTDEYAELIAVQNNLAFISLSDIPAVYVFDISDPAHPDTVASIDIDGYLEVQDSMLYVYYGWRTPSLSIFNISDPANIFLADSYDTPGGGKLFVQENMVYLDDGYSAMILKTPYGDISTSVTEENGKAQPRSIELSQNYPNPFNPSTVIDFNVPRRSQVTIELFNTSGQKVRTLIDEPKPAGSYQVAWDGTDGNGAQVATGIYFYRLTIGDNSATKKMVLLK